MALLDDKVKEQLKGVLGKLKDDVNLIFFTQENECSTCKETYEFLEDVTGLSDKLNLKVYDFQKDSKSAEDFGVDKVPSILLLDKDENNTGIRFLGLPGGHEINSFVQSLLEVSGEKEELSSDIISKIKGIDKDVHIQVFVLST
jgi:glutaredoxin-like protein